jgi:hypothetical protein
MHNEHRKNARKHIEYPANILLEDGTTRACFLFDASETGARLVVKDPVDVPDKFTLTFGHEGAARRQCQVAWREGSQIGLHFLKPEPVRRAR